MEWLAIAAILVAFVAATLWDSLSKEAARARLGDDHSTVTIDRFLQEMHRGPV